MAGPTLFILVTRRKGQYLKQTRLRNRSKQFIEQCFCFERRSHNYSVPVDLAAIETYIVTRIGIL